MKRLIALIVLLVFGSVAYADYEMSDSEKERYLKWGAQFQDQGLYSFDRPVALAVSPNGCYGMAVLCNGCFQISWQSTLKILKRDALRSCKWKCKSSACKIMDVNGTSAFIKQRGSSSSSSTASTVRTLQIGGGTYIGDVVDGRANGQGTYTFPDGYKYVGEWKDGKQHGQGTYTTAGGNKYVGEKTDGKKHGQGTYTFADGRKYVGEWKDSKKHGQGTYTYADGQKYVGEWKDGYRHGKGTYTYTSGNKYIGEFKNEKPWEGVSYLASGEIAATFSNGKLCRDCTPTAEQLAIVGEISATPITTPLAQPVGAQDKALSGDASPVIATLEELQDELEMAEKIELANELARGGAKNNDYSEQNKTASTPLTDPFLLAQSSYQVYKHTNDNDALSLAFASIHIAMEADQDNYKVFFLAGLIANEMPNNIIASQLAAVYFERASMLNLNDAPLHYIIAQNLYTKNRARESLEYFERALLLENRFLTPEYILILSQAYIQAGQASRGATFFDAYRKNRSNLRLPAYLISTAAYLQFADQIRIILADASYSIKDKERAMKMLEGASH